jgi:hypothetical protein
MNTRGCKFCDNQGVDAFRFCLGSDTRQAAYGSGATYTKVETRIFAASWKNSGEEHKYTAGGGGMCNQYY